MIHLKTNLDLKPLLLVPVIALLALPLVGSFDTWLTLSVAGLAIGMIIFIMASGLTLVFGLMDVLNFGHGVFIALGAFVATSVLSGMVDWTQSQELWRNLVAVGAAMMVAMIAAAVIGLAFERFIVRPVYGQHLKQILITMGGMIIGEEIIKVIWGPLQIALPLPEAMRGSLLWGDASLEKYRLMAVVVGLIVFALQAWTLSQTKVGLLIRAGVQDREMVEALGYKIRRLFVGVFVVGSGRFGRRDVGFVSAKRGAPNWRASERAYFHCHHHGWSRFYRWRTDWRFDGGPHGQLHRLLVAQVSFVFQHRAHGGYFVVAATRGVPRGQPLTSKDLHVETLVVK
jgi:branched-chain amino acid transport system permease protein